MTENAKLEQLEEKIQDLSKKAEDLHNRLQNDILLQPFAKKASEEILEAINQKDALIEKINEVQKLGTEVRNEIEELKKLKTDVDEFYNDIVEKINGLLPNAAATGLAAHYELRAQFAGWKKMIPDYFVWAAFIISLVSLGYLFYHIISTEGSQGWLAILLRITCGTPLIWFAWVLQRLIFQNKRLREEYFHKASLMRTYVGFQNEIETLSSDVKNDIRGKLLKVVLENINFNASKAVHTSTDFIKGNNELNSLTRALEAFIKEKNKE